MITSLTKLTLLISISFPFIMGFSQDDGGETAAEASVTGSAAQPNFESSGSIEGNPLVLAVRSGLISLDDAMRLGLGKIRELAALGGNFDELLRGYLAAGDVDLEMVRKLFALGLSEELLTATLKVAADYDSSNLQNQEALVLAATVAKGFLVDRTITSTESLDDITSINVSDFTSNGYNIALVEILNKYGAIGAKGDSLLDAEFGSSRTLSTALTAEASSDKYLDLLTTLTGGRTLTDTVLGTKEGSEDATKSTVISVSMDNVDLTPGADITIGTAASSSSIDVSDDLPQSTATADRKIYILGAAKDLKVAGDVTFKNTNEDEDHALVLGAADDFMLSGKNLTYEGSNLALGAGGNDGDSMYLENTSITTGGNLAVGSLGKVQMTNVVLNVGNGGYASDPDNLYIYANDQIDIFGLTFSNSRLDDVYMEAITVNLKDVVFPPAAQVHLRSRDGTLAFGTFDSPTKGAVNLTNVIHQAINVEDALTKDDFTATSVGFKSSTTLATGYNAFTISKQNRSGD